MKWKIYEDEEWRKIDRVSEHAQENSRSIRKLIWPIDVEDSDLLLITSIIDSYSYFADNAMLLLSEKNEDTTWQEEQSITRCLVNPTLW